MVTRDFDTNIASSRRYTREGHTHSSGITVSASHTIAFWHDRRPEWSPLDVDAAKARLRGIMSTIHTPVSVVNGHLHISESAMLHDTLYPVTIDGFMYYIVRWSHDEALEIFGVEP